MARAPQRVASGAYVIVDNEDDPGAFWFAPRVAPEEIPPEQKKVIGAAIEHYRNIIEYIETKSVQNEWLENLRQIASLGAVQQEGLDPPGALEQIKNREKLLKERLGNFLRPARDRLVRSAAIVFALAMICGVGLRWMTPGEAVKFDPGRLSNYAFAIAGAMPALVIQYLGAIKYVTAKSYAELKSDLWSPALDTLACAIMCVFVVALLATGAIAVNIKGLETKDVEANVRTAVVVGIICGLASRRLGPALLGLGTKVISRIR
jgi:hypothetical protein